MPSRSQREHASVRVLHHKRGRMGELRHKRSTANAGDSVRGEERDNPSDNGAAEAIVAECSRRMSNHFPSHFLDSSHLPSELSEVSIGRERAAHPRLSRRFF